MQSESLQKNNRAAFESFGKERKLEKQNKLKERMVAVKRLVIEIATRKINEIFMVPNRNVKTYFSVIIKSLCRQTLFTIRSLTNTIQISRLNRFLRFI